MKYYVLYKIDKYNNIENVKKKKFNKAMKQIAEIQKKIEFELIFSQRQSFFKRKEILVSENEDFLYMMASGGVFSDVIYCKNTKSKYKITDFQGEQFKIMYPYQQYDWKITKETKVIKGYTCFKAITEWEEYDHGRDITLKFKPFVWFTFDLPFPYGPKGLDGLPGLVLEGSFNGVTYFKVSKIEKRDDIMFPKIKHSEEIKFKDYLKLIGENSRMGRR